MMFTGAHGRRRAATANTQKGRSSKNSNSIHQYEPQQPRRSRTSGHSNLDGQQRSVSSGYYSMDNQYSSADNSFADLDNAGVSSSSSTGLWTSDGGHPSSLGSSSGGNPSTSQTPCIFKARAFRKISKRRGAIKHPRSHESNGHRFVAKFFRQPTFCAFCKEFLWGFGKQGYQCITCQTAVHKKCHDKLLTPCSESSFNSESTIASIYE